MASLRYSKKKSEKLRSKNLEFFILMVLAESEPNS
jgi:hypothetical protein